MNEPIQSRIAPEPKDKALDLRARGELALAFDPSQAPARLFCAPPPLTSRRGFRGSMAGLLVAGACAATVFVIRPPRLVRSAIEHELYERSLRGSYMGSKLLERLGLNSGKVMPGSPQTMRPCDIAGHLAYHLTTFFERGDMVTVYACDEPVTLKSSEG